MILAVIQARLSSTRLPGKVLKPLAGAPMILRQVERTRRAARLDRLLVATSVDPSDDPLVEVLQDDGVEVFRGPLDDVLARYIGAMEAHGAGHVVRMTADCPLIDPQVIDATVDLLFAENADYAHCRTQSEGYPKGLDVEVITAEALRRAAALAETREEREHVTYGVWSRPDLYKVVRLQPPFEQGHVRWTVDRPDDLAFVQAVYAALYPANPAFTSEDVRAFVRARPEWAQWGGDARV